MNTNGVPPELREAGPVAEQLRQFQKLEAVGRLAGSVAHDFNNLLTVIIGCCQLLQERHAAEPEARSLLEEIRKAAEQGSHVTRQLLLFSRKQTSQPAILSLNDLVANLAKILRRLIGENIELLTDLEPFLGSVRADPGQLQQVILNLAINARDAMPSGGQLRIETRNLLVQEAAEGGVPPGTYATLVVRDTGCGMSDDVLAHLFEPFFTTKGLGRGTGLGLATVYSIIQQSGGHIRVASKLGKGARIRIYLPEVEGKAAAVRGAAASLPRAAANTTILVVEDEPAVRAFAAMVLRAEGYQVLEAANAVEAVAAGDGHKAPIDLLLTDVVLPYMSGPKLAVELVARRPQLKVLYMSGYTDSHLARHDGRDLQRTLLQKPFTPEALLQAVCQTLRPALVLPPDRP